MKKPSPLLVMLLISAVCGAVLHAADVLTQQDVIKLLELKIPEQTVIDKVKSSGTAFVLGTDDIARLKKAGASDALIAAMQSSSAVPPTGNPASEITDLALIIDYSGSMNAKMKDGAAKVASAKRCVTDLIDKLPNDLNVALVVYGTSKPRGCEDIDIVQPLGPMDKADLKTKINNYRATGMTPIATSLTKAGEELKKAKGGSAIVLVTDGAESCHGDPAGVAARLAAEFGTKFGINVIGFGIEPQEKKQLADIADKGHGKLLTVENASELADALKKVVAEKVAPAPKQREAKDFEAAGKAVKPGAFFYDAPLVEPGEYKGQLAMMQAHYYQVAVRKGQELRAIGIVQKTPYEAGNNIVNQVFRITIYNNDLSVAGREHLVIKDNPTTPGTFKNVWTATQDGPVYVAISASDNLRVDDTGEGGDPVEVYKPKEPAPSPYTLRIKLEGEAAAAVSSPIPAVTTSPGPGFQQAAEIPIPTTAGTDLKLGEVVFYRAKVKKGDTVQASTAFRKPWYKAGNNQVKATYTVTLYDDDQVQVAQEKKEVKDNPPDADSISLSWPVTTSGNVYLSVGCENTGAVIYPKDFQPKPGEMCVRLAGPAVAASATTAEEKAPDETTKDSSKKDPFSGAESESMASPASPSATPQQ